MRYLRVSWVHDFATEPVELFSEIGDDGYETRKVEVFRGGHMTYADESRSTGSTILGETPIPAFEEIERQSEFVPEWITRDQFEAAWVAALGSP